MYRFIESIRVENRRLMHPEWHNRRMNETRSRFFGLSEAVQLEELVRIPEDLTDGVCKCRIVYDDSIREITLAPYTPRLIRSLKLVQADELNYSFKLEDRSALNELLRQKGDADDVVIVQNGFLTDTSFSNIVLFDGTSWVTPDTYLLNGTTRQRLLKDGKITERPVAVGDLHLYREVRLINAMLVLSETPPAALVY